MKSPSLAAGLLQAAQARPGKETMSITSKID
jgi:hypothetical protein